MLDFKKAGLHVKNRVARCFGEGGALAGEGVPLMVAP